MMDKTTTHSFPENKLLTDTQAEGVSAGGSMLKYALKDHEDFRRSVRNGFSAAGDAITWPFRKTRDLVSGLIG